MLTPTPLPATSRQRVPPGHPTLHPANLDHLRRLLSIGNDFHLGLALPLAVPDGQGQVSGLVALQDVGLATTPGKDVLQKVGQGRGWV